MERDYVKRRASHYEVPADISPGCPPPVYLSYNISHSDSYPGDNTMVPWYNVLLDSTLSTTRYLTDHYANVEFRVTGQEERDGHIYRISEFLLGNRIIVHSIVDIPVSENPSKFIDIMREQVTPIGDALRDNGYHVEREILYHDASSKVYAMRGDVNLRITELYYTI
jgi:hypothetical protein